MPVVMIHGNSISGRIFRNQSDGALGRNYRIIAPDLLGHGHSSDAIDPTRTYNMPGQASAMAEFLALIGVDRAVVFGWSLGGYIGLEMVSRFPGMLGLMITGTPPVAAEEIPLGFLPTPHRALSRKQDFTEEDIATYARVTCGEPQEPLITETIRRTDGRARKMNREKFASGAGGDQSAIAASCPVPIAIVNGRNEPFVNLDFLSKVKFGSLWEGRCHVIQNSGHAPFWDAPERFNQIFARFLQDMEEIWCRN